MTLSELAARIDVSPAYLSALEHGHRGTPGPVLLGNLRAALGLGDQETDALWRLVRLSHPRVTVNTAGLDPARTELANRLSHCIAELPDPTVAAMLALLPREAAHHGP